MKIIVKACASILLLWSFQSAAKTGVEFLQEAPAPEFKEGHTLLPLTRWAWGLSYELNVELAQRWGYALDIDPGPIGEALDKPSSVASKLVAFNQANGHRYPVSVNTRRVMFERDKIQERLSPQAWCRHADGTLVLRGSHPVMKPYLSDADANVIAQAEVQRLKRLRDLGVKTTLVLNGAEYMPGVPGHDRTEWLKDPEVAAWLKSHETLPAERVVDAFASNKLKQEKAVRDAVLAVMPESEVVYYVTGDVRRGIVNELIRLNWAYPYRHMINAGTIPSWEYYYGYFGFWVPSNGSKDYLIYHATNGAAQGIEDGRPLSYNWLSAGWSLKTPSLVSDDKRYMGFLKFLYTLGSSGNVAGYFNHPPEGFNGDIGTTAPDWLRQIMLLSHAHATFTHLEDYLRQGVLLPGDGNHAYSIDLYGTKSWVHPAYEFATSENSQSVRVAARKLKDAAEWLIVAWAAAGEDREVSVSIPGLGKVSVLARAEGTLYHAKVGPILTLLDPAGMDPSRSVADLLRSAGNAKPAPPTDIVVD
jgi:hypothetical protein